MFLSSSPLIPIPFQFSPNSCSFPVLPLYPLLTPSFHSPLLLLFFPTSLNLLPYLFLPFSPLTYTTLLFNLFPPYPCLSLFGIVLSLSLSNHPFEMSSSSPCRLFPRLLSTPPPPSLLFLPSPLIYIYLLLLFHFLPLHLSILFQFYLYLLISSYLLL
jgi:hypothetical protein